MSVLTWGRDRLSGLVAESVYDNPVVTRELRTRMRGLKGFLVMGGYVLLVGAVLFITYMILWNEFASSSGYVANIANRNVGLRLFRVLTWTQAILLSLAIPALTFSSLTQELERKSMEMLALTRLSAGKIVLGKQLSGFLYALVLLGCTLPLSSMCLMFGGVSPAEIGVMYAILVAWAFLLTCVGVFWSSLFNRTASAALFAYGVMGLYFLLTIPLGILTAPPYGGGGEPHPLGALNPGWAAYTSMMTASVCGIKLSIATVAVAMHAALGVLLLMVASTHVRYHKVRRSVPIKLFTVAITLALVWLFVGGLKPPGGRPYAGDDVRELLSIAGPMVLAMLCLMASVFATGEMTKKREQLMAGYALSPRKVLSADLGGAIWFMALWAATLFGGLVGTTWWLMRSQSIKVPHSVWEAGIRYGLSAVAIVIGISAVGVLASSVVKARRNAAALVLLFVILAWSGYGIVLAYHVPGITDTKGPVWQLAAFWPMTPGFAIEGWSSLPKLWWKPAHSWAVTGAAYLAIAIAAILLASGPANRGSGVKED